MFRREGKGERTWERRKTNEQTETHVLVLGWVHSLIHWYTRASTMLLKVAKGPRFSTNITSSRKSFVQSFVHVHMHMPDAKLHVCTFVSNFVLSTGVNTNLRQNNDDDDDCVLLVQFILAYFF